MLALRPEVAAAEGAQRRNKLTAAQPRSAESTSAAASATAAVEPRQPPQDDSNHGVPGLVGDTKIGAAVLGRRVGGGGVAGALWQQPLEYGACEEYHVDLTSNRLFFLTPEGNGSCEVTELDSADDAVPWEVNEIGFTLGHSDSNGFKRRVAAQQEGDDPQTAYRVIEVSSGQWPPARLVVALMEEPKGGCRVEAVALSPQPRNARLPLPVEDGGDSAPAAELAVMDTFSRADIREDESQEEVAMDEDDASQGLAPLVPLDSVAVVRLEDAIEPGTMMAEVIGSRTLGFGHAYAIEPRALHVVLEDLRGAHVLGREDVAFEAGRTYVGLRVGKEEDPAFPQRLVVYQVQEGAAESAAEGR